MEPLLVGVTGAALVLAFAMSVVAWKLLRIERERSRARVEALEALAFEETSDPPALASFARETPERMSHPPHATTATADPPVVAQEGEDLAALPAEQDWDLSLGAGAPIHPAAEDAHRPTVAVEALFTPRAATLGHTRWLALAAVALTMTGGGFIVSTWRSPGLFSTLAAAPDAAATAAKPLELLSLKHSIDADGSFNVTGLVQNPADGQPQSGIVAVVYLFDEAGRFFVSGRGTLDVTNVHPGDESPFVVKIPHVGKVSRYRIGFRRDDGGVVAHVDRRGQAPIGTTSEPVGRGPATPSSVDTAVRAEGELE